MVEEVFKVVAAVLRGWSMMLCAGCGRSIEDRVVLSVNGLLWHGDCLQCCQCRQPLTDKCFCRDNKFYCRADYLRFVNFVATWKLTVTESTHRNSLPQQKCNL